MADFVAVLRKTVDALGENTPEMREKVFDKARATIEAKLKAIQPPPPQPVIDRQRGALEDAIAVIRADYATKAEPAKDETLEDIFASLKTLSEAKPEPRPAFPAAHAPARPAVGAGAPAKVDGPGPVVAGSQATGPTASVGDVSRQPAPAMTSDPVVDTLDKAPDNAPQGPPTEDGSLPLAAGSTAAEPRQRRRVGAGLIAAVIAVLIVVAGGYGVWVNRDDFAVMVGMAPEPADEGDAATTAGDLPAPEATEPEQVAETEEPQEEEPQEEIAALEPAEEESASESASSGESDKFTQRLLPDGSEVDEGPAGGPRSIGEGSSVAAATQAGTNETATDASGTDQDEVAVDEDGEAVAPTQTSAGESVDAPASVAVGQKAIFYEERTTSASGSAEVGNIVWSMVEESPGGDLPPEPAIRAQATIPGKDIQLRMTIRRNGDQTLPASHIIEMIFLTPEGFEGGGIANVTRVSFKETEQAAGNALIGIPAKIADGFFLIALGDAPAEVETNTTLLRRQSWIDIPITYESGRRALLSMEKGIPGDKVFQDAMRAWSEAGSG